MRLLQKDSLVEIIKGKRPDPEAIRKYEEGFKKLDESLKRDLQKFLLEERKRIQETAMRAENYMLS